MPGRMSWNCCRQTVRQAAVSASYGYAAPVRTAAVVAHSSASRSRCSLRRLPRLVRAWLRVGARGGTPGRARPTRPGASGSSACASVKNSTGLASRTARRALERRRTPGGREHLAGGSAAAVAVAERHQRRGWPTAFSVKFRSARARSRRRQVGVVGVDGREVGEDLGAVDALPAERRVRHDVGVVPARSSASGTTSPPPRP